jgi:hypothetical protein
MPIVEHGVRLVFFLEDVGDIRVARYVPDIDYAGLLSISDGDLPNVEKVP